MRVNLVFGRSGTGKSEYLYKDITSKMGDKKIFLIVPEQCNLSAEKKLFDISGKTSLIDVEILTLSRMAYRVENEVGFKNMERLSKVGKEMIINKEQAETVKMIFELYLKGYGIGNGYKYK